jgi:DNA invertase Pin-like site-specific DNA recombinase
MISKRTKAALAAAKARGTKLGGWRPHAEMPDTKEATEANRKAAKAFAAQVGPLVREMRESGLSLAKIADKLAEQQVRTARGGQWTPTAVKNLLAQVEQVA